VSHGIRSNRYGKSNLLSRNYFAVIDNSLKKSVSRQAQRVLELQDQDEKRLVPPTTIRFDLICPIKTTFPLARLSDYVIDYVFDCLLTHVLLVVKRDRVPEVLGSTLHVSTRNMNLFEMVETVLQCGKGRVKNRGRGSTRPTQVDGRLVAAQ
jgi:hypothetical protein